ncbi:MAG: hypothetical protein ACKPKO_25470, partial [Candidatus Fonsibacter sp.]
SQQMIDWAIDGMMEVQDTLRIQHTAGRQDRVPLAALQVRAQELLQRTGHIDPRRVQDGGERGMATPFCGNMRK